MADIDKLELLFEGLKESVKAGEKIMADGKVDWSDSAHIPELYKSLEKVVKAAKEYKELKEEISDIQGDEAIKLVAKLFE